MTTEGADKEAKHVDLALAVVSLERHDVAGGVVKKRVDAQRACGARNGDGGPVADVALPQRAGTLCLPAQARGGAGAVSDGDAIESVLDEEAAHGGLRDGALVEPSIADERAENERDGGRGVLAPDVQKKRTLLGPELMSAAPVTARFGAERGEATLAIGIVPALQGGDGKAAHDVAAGRAEALLAQLDKDGAQVAVVQLAPAEDANDLASKNGNGLGVVRWGEHIAVAIFGHGVSGSRRAVLGSGVKRDLSNWLLAFKGQTGWASFVDGTAVAGHHGMCSPPKKARSISDRCKTDSGACADSAMAQRPATRRRGVHGGLAGVVINSVLSTTARIQRRSVFHCRTDSWPTTRRGLTRSRTAASERPPSPHRAIAKAIAAAEKYLRRITPRGTTVMVPWQTQHR